MEILLNWKSQLRRLSSSRSLWKLDHYFANFDQEQKSSYHCITL